MFGCGTVLTKAMMQRRLLSKYLNAFGHYYSSDEYDYYMQNSKKS